MDFSLNLGCAGIAEAKVASPTAALMMLLMEGMLRDVVIYITCPRNYID
jgi:hypothetical protein